MQDVFDDLWATFAGQYDVERELTGGGMSRLFLATERVLGRQVVIKVLPPELTSAVGAARFRRETEVTARLQHPNILPILSAGAHRDVLYYVMPYVAGESLRARMTRDGALSVSEALRLLVEVADALACAHDAGVIHRDIKPENVLLQSGHALLADFGVAAALSGDAPAAGGQKLTRTGTAPGTVGYMAPEQLAGDGVVDARSDVYSLGVVAYELLAGRRLFEAENAQALLVAHLVDEPAPLDELRFDVPGHVARAIERALAKKPDARWQAAAELRDALQRSLAVVMSAEGGVEKDPLGRRVKVAVRRFRSSLTTQRMTLPKGVPARRSPVRWIAGVVVLLAAAAAAYSWRASHATPSETVTIAVAPFEVLTPDPELDLWREGIVDVLARNLDGAGTIRTVPPTRALRSATSPITVRNAAAFARDLGAEYALVGQFTPTIGDSVTARVWLVSERGDSASTVLQEEWRMRDVRDAADAMSVAVVRTLTRLHRIGAVRADTSLAAAHPIALREFLRGEQFYRRTAWDSALAAYGRALARDSGFALPLRRIALVREWQMGGDDATAATFARRAARFAARLPARDSLLVTADSISATLTELQRESAGPDWALSGRLFSTLNEAATRYPDDPEVWYTLGEARFHHGYGRQTGVTERSALDAFDRAIALDSSFAPAYVHPVELAFRLDGQTAARRYSTGYLRLATSDQQARVIRLLDRLMETSNDVAAQDRVLDSASTADLQVAWYRAARWRDPGELGVRLMRKVESRMGRPDTTRAYRTASLRVRSLLSLQTAYRGRFAESYAVLGDRSSRLYAELAYLGAIPPAHADSVLERWIGDSTGGRAMAVRWGLAFWAQRGDTAAIGRVLEDAERRRSAARTPPEQRQATATVAAAEAYAALARRDTAAAIARFAGMSDTLCLDCYLDRFTHGRLLLARRDHPGALRVLGERINSLVTPVELLFHLERGRAEAQLGRVAEARRSFTTVIEAWGRGDRTAEPFVRVARDGLARLPATGTSR